MMKGKEYRNDAVNLFSTFDKNHYEAIKEARRSSSYRKPTFEELKLESQKEFLEKLKTLPKKIQIFQGLFNNRMPK